MIKFISFSIIKNRLFKNIQVPFLFILQPCGDDITLGFNLFEVFLKNTFMSNVENDAYNAT